MHFLEKTGSSDHIIAALEGRPGLTVEGRTSPMNYLENIMSKERKSNREEKKKAVMTPKEKKAARKSRKESRGLLGEHGV